MAADPLTEGWISYREAVLRFYSAAGPSLRERRGLDVEAEDEVDRALAAEAERALAEAAEYSAALAGAAEESLREPDEEIRGRAEDRVQDRMETLVIAVAAVDAAVAYSALAVSSGAPLPEPPVAEDLRGPQESPFDTIAVADLLFGSPEGLGVVGGACGDPALRQLRGECYEALDRLIAQAGEPAFDFTAGMAFGAVAALLPGGRPPVDFLHHLAQQTGRIKGHALKLLASCLRKLIAVAGVASEVLSQVANAVVQEAEQEAAQEAFGAGFTQLLGRAAGGNQAQVCVERVLVNGAARAVAAGALEVPPRAGAEIRYELAGLTSAYAQMMDRASSAAKWLGIASPLLVALAAPAAVPALNGVGLGFVFYTLGGRLEGRVMPSRVAGVVAITSRHLPS